MSKGTNMVEQKKCMNAKTVKDVHIVLNVPRKKKETELLDLTEN